MSMTPAEKLASKKRKPVKQGKAATKLWELRMQHGLSQRDVAGTLGISDAIVCRIEQQYSYAANKLGKGLAGAGKAAKDAAEKAGKAAKDTAGNFKKYNQRVPIMPNMDAFNAYRGN